MQPDTLDYVLVPFLAIAGFMDLVYGKVPNSVTFPVILIGLVLSFILHGFSGLTGSIVGFLIGIIVFLPFFIVKGIGGGDLKLFAAIGALKGYLFLFQSIIFSSLIAVVISLVVLVRHGVLVKSLNKTFRFFYSLVIPGFKVEYPDKNNSYPVPYGLAIVIGTLIVFFRNR